MKERNWLTAETEGQNDQRETEIIFQRFLHKMNQTQGNQKSAERKNQIKTLSKNTKKKETKWLFGFERGAGATSTEAFSLVAGLDSEDFKFRPDFLSISPPTFPVCLKLSGLSDDTQKITKRCRKPEKDTEWLYYKRP